MAMRLAGLWFERSSCKLCARIWKKMFLLIERFDQAYSEKAGRAINAVWI